MSGYPVQIDSLPPSSDFHQTITPLLSGVAAGPISIDGVGTANLVPNYILVCINPGDDVIAATRLKAGAPEVFMVRPGESLEITSSVAITDVYFMAVDATAAAPANYTGNAYIMAKADTDLSDWLAQMAHLTFNEVDAVRKATVTLSDVISTNYATAHVQGVSYA